MTIVVAGVLLASAATYTRDSLNPLAWRNLSVQEVQGKFGHCFKKVTVASLFACDYRGDSGTAAVRPRAGQNRPTESSTPASVAEPATAVDGGVVAVGYAPAPQVPAPSVLMAAPVTAPRPAINAANFPVIAFPAGPMPAIEAACESAKQAAERQGPAYVQNVERQCEAAKQAYERAHA